MIYYTLLPQEKIKALRKEYHIRLFITIMFFISCILLFGVFLLIPSYISTYNKEGRALDSVKEIEKGRAERGADEIEKELKSDNIRLQSVLDLSKYSINNSELIQNIISNRSNNILIYSFSLNKEEGTSTPTEIIIQGRSSTREALIDFKEGLESIITKS